MRQRMTESGRGVTILCLGGVLGCVWACVRTGLGGGKTRLVEFKREI